MIVALAYALYALLRDPLGEPGAAAVTAGAMALVALLIGVLFLRRGSSRGHAGDDQHHPAAALAGAMPERVLHLVRAQPILALGAAAVGVYVLLRRPGLLALAASSLLGMGAQKKIDKRRRR
jgi:ABC-type Fe3+-siderophore transport system permease subunit